MTEQETAARAWIGSLAAYNAGRLIGAWIDLDGKDEDEVREEASAAILEQLKDEDNAHLELSPQSVLEELWCFDHEGIGAIVRGECGIGTAVEAAETLGAVEDSERDAFLAYIENGGAADRDSFRDAYCGEWRSEREYAEELIEDVGGVESDSLAGRYFDYEAFTRDLFMSDYYSLPAPGGLVYVFRNV